MSWYILAHAYHKMATNLPALSSLSWGQAKIGKQRGQWLPFCSLLVFSYMMHVWLTMRPCLWGEQRRFLPLAQQGLIVEWWGGRGDGRKAGQRTRLLSAPRCTSTCPDSWLHGNESEAGECDKGHFPTYLSTAGHSHHHQQWPGLFQWHSIPRARPAHPGGPAELECAPPALCDHENLCWRPQPAIFVGKWLTGILYMLLTHPEPSG